MTIHRFGNIISTNLLREQIRNIKTPKASPVRVIETTSAPNIDIYKEHFLPHHIPTAQYFDYLNCVPRSKYFLRSIPDSNLFEDIAQSLGINNDTHVITYDRVNLLSAIRTWWLFRLFGHRKVSVLDGGFKKWVADEYEVSDEVSKYEEGNFEAEVDETLIRDYDNMLNTVESKKDQIMDARNSHSFQGTDGKDLDYKKGHIPGAKNIPFSTLFNADSTFKSEHELKLLFDAASIDLSKPVTAMCETGLTGCGLVIASNILGKEMVPLYAGSMYEWGQRAPDELCVTGKH